MRRRKRPARATRRAKSSRGVRSRSGWRESLSPAPLALERVVLAAEGLGARAPDAAVAERLWRNQVTDTVRWRETAPWRTDFHFSLVALVRCEIQTIDQYWSLRRVALALPDGRSTTAWRARSVSRG